MEAHRHSGLATHYPLLTTRYSLFITSQYYRPLTLLLHTIRYINFDNYYDACSSTHYILLLKSAYVSITMCTHYWRLSTCFLLLTAYCAQLTITTSHYVLKQTSCPLLLFTLPAYNYSLLTTHHSLLTTHGSLPTTHYTLPTVRHPLLTTHYLPHTIHHLPQVYANATPKLWPSTFGFHELWRTAHPTLPWT